MRKTLLAIISLLVYANTATAWTPAESARPWSFWYWMYGAVTKPAVKADLEGMKQVGLAGTYLMPIRGVDEKPEYEGKAAQLTPEFWDMVDYSMAVADSLGMKMGVHICDGFALAGGPWFTPEESMQRIIWSEAYVDAKALKTKTADVFELPLPTRGLQGVAPIAAYAIPVADTLNVIKPVAMTYSDNVTSNEKFLVSANDPCWFTFDFGMPVDIRNVEVIPNGTNFQCQRMKVEVSDDNVTFSHHADLTPARQGWQNYLYNLTYSLPYTTDDNGDARRYRYYRFVWTPAGTEPGSEDLDAAKWKPNIRLKNLVFHQDAHIHHFEGKAGYAWRVAEESTTTDLPDNLCAPLTGIIPLAYNSDGTLNLMPLKDKKLTGKTRNYRVVNIGHASTGMTNATAGGGKGLECDKFSKAAVNKLIDNWFAQFVQLPHAKNVLKCFHVDSWECGCQNWSSNFASEFKVRRGYDLMPWLPVMVGIPVENAKESERVLRDVRETINDLINDNFFATVRERAHEMGMEFSSEAIAPTMVSDGLDHYRYADVPMGEYWLNSPTHDKPNDMLDAISGGHIYGKNIIQAEGFTEVRGVWDETPANIKTLLDRNLALGMNRLFFHVNAHNPWMDKKPGMTLDGIGLFFQRDQTWYYESKPFVDYITRCSALLQQGHPVVDIAVYTGNEMPRRSITPDRLVPMLPGVFGEARVASEKARLVNIGQPITESPVGVFHSAGIVDLKDWINPLNGYHYDSLNPDVLAGAKAADGWLTLEGGAKYRVLVVPQVRPLNPNGVISDVATKKIEEMRQAGVVVIDQPFTERNFKNYGLEPDVVLPEGIAYAHRSANEGEIYFLANQSDEQTDIVSVFRDRIGQDAPYIYNPVSNTICLAKCKDEQVFVTLAANGSCFVIYPRTKVEDILSCLPEMPTAIEAIKADTVSSVELAGPWTLTLREAGKTVEIPELKSWTELEEDNLMYFSGHGMYQNTLKLTAKPKGTEMMSFDEVHDIAHVWVNGIDCGIVWTAPYEVKIGHALKKGKNMIEIEVVNTWANALRGNDEGHAPYDGIWTNARYRMKQPHLIPAGLVGGVRMLKY